MTQAELVHVVDEEAGTYSFRGKLDTVEVTRAGEIGRRRERRESGGLSWAPHQRPPSAPLVRAATVIEGSLPKEPGPRSTGRALEILRLLTLVCAGVMACSSTYRLDAAILATIALAQALNQGDQ